MLEWLATYMGWMNVGHIGFRACSAFVTALIITLFLGPYVIRWLKKKQKDGQPIRECGPETHMVKKGTPTMGGLMILLAVTLTTLLWADLGNIYVLTSLVVFLVFGLIGGVDDYLKLTSHSSKGITGKKRLAIEFAISLGAILMMTFVAGAGTSTTLSIPFLGQFCLKQIKADQASRIAYMPSRMNLWLPESGLLCYPNRGGQGYRLHRIGSP